MNSFTMDDAERANEAWGCNCGPTALAEIADLSLDEVRPLFGSDWPGYTNPTAMRKALDASALRYSWDGLRKGVSTMQWPRFGLARIQWEGPWVDPKVPAGARYQQTHWVGVAPTDAFDGRAIWDVNAMVFTKERSGWVSLADWERVIVPAITREIRRADGKWHITHVAEVEMPKPWETT